MVSARLSVLVLAACCLLSALTPQLTEAQTIAATYTISVQAKSASHPFLNLGFPSAFTANGTEYPTLTLTRGLTYRFIAQSVPSIHPFYITNDASGAGAGTNYFGADVGITGSQTIDFTVPLNAPAQLFSGCLAHQYMGFPIVVADAAVVVSSTGAASVAQSSTASAPVAVSSTASAPAAQSSTASEPAAQSSTASAPAAASSTASAPAAQSSTASEPAAQSSTASAPAAQSSTASAPAAQSSTASAPAAQSSTASEPAAASSTASAPVAQSSTASAPVAQSSTASEPAAQSSTASAPAAASSTASAPAAQSSSASAPVAQSSTASAPAAQSSTGSVPVVASSTGTVAPATPTFCEKYTRLLFGSNTAQNETDLFTAVVERMAAGCSTCVPAVTGIFTAGTPTRPFFDGTIDYRGNGATPNYLNNTAALNILVAHLVQFFGGAFGCNAPGFPAYQGNPSMRAVHKNMPITQPIMDFFTTELATTLLSFGVDVNDLQGPGEFLLGFQRFSGEKEICNQPDCDLAPGAVVPTPSSTAPPAPPAPSSTGAPQPPPSSSAPPAPPAPSSTAAPQPAPSTGAPQPPPSSTGAPQPAPSTAAPQPPASSTGAPQPPASSTGVTPSTNSTTGAPVAGSSTGVPAPGSSTGAGAPPSSTGAARRPSSSTGAGAPTAVFTSFCDKYTLIVPGYGNPLSAANETALMQAFVVRAFTGCTTCTPVVQGLIAPGSPTRPFFDGSIDYRGGGATPNYLTNGPALNILVAHLTQFFGAALGCSATGFPFYEGNPNMQAVHRGMRITQAVMDYFNSQFAASLQSYGVTMVDQDGVIIPFLLQFQRGSGSREICNQPDCQYAPGVIAYTWRIGVWGQCSTYCNGGIQTRSVVCIDSNGAGAPDANCPQPKPDSSAICNTVACTTGVKGDPEFMGFRGQKYEVHGIPDGVFNIITSPLVQYNAQFVFIGTKTSYAAQCNNTRTKAWTHAGTYLGKLGLKVGRDQIQLNAGSCIDGLASVNVNGKKLKVGDKVQIGDENACNGIQTITYTSWDRVHFSLCEVELTLVNSDNFFNQVAQITKYGWESKQMHGLLGQTWSTKTYDNELGWVEGSTFDYQEQNDDLFGDEFTFNKFSTDKHEL